MAKNSMNRKLIWITSRVVSRLRRVQAKIFKKDELAVLLDRIPMALSGTDLQGQVVVITGSSHGVGLVIAKAFAEAGAQLVINGRDAKQVAQAVKVIRDAGGIAEEACADISTELGAQQLIQTALTKLGRVDLLINNAAVLGPLGQNYTEISELEWNKVMDVNVNGAFYCAKLVSAWMKKNAVTGRIINISSGAARSTNAGLAPYSVSKAALEMMTRMMALESEHSGITVVGLELSSLQTEMTRAFFAWEDFQLLPPPEIVIPFFTHAATAPGISVNGRILAAWRFLKDQQAESLLCGPLAETERFQFTPTYRDGEPLNRFDPAVVAVDRAENPFGMPESVRELLKNTAQDCNFARYPDEHYPALRKTLSQQLSLPEDCFSFGNGSSELVERILRIFTQPGDEVLSNDPTWFMFDRFCQNMGVVNRKIPFKEVPGGFDHNLQQIVAEIRYSTRLIYLINPSNPVGAGISAKAFQHFLQQVPKHIPVVVDEAYLEYSCVPETLRSHQVVMNTDRLVLGLRTFSKFYALADLRIGYAFGGPDVMRLFNRIEPLFPLSGLAERAAVAALTDEAHAKRTLENAINERKRIRDKLAGAGLASFNSEMNIMIVECPVPPERVYQAFDQQGVLVPKGVWNERFIIFPIATPELNDRNLQILMTA
ncbi:MAG: SDR family NAD(P)-dependent oxidoreductase [Methylomonas sp.]|nr:SDR family NAD(P)-dependent oxidoreductase [Methylomonas sp.]